MARGEELTDEQWAVLPPLMLEPPFDYHAENYLGFVHLGCIKILLRYYL